MKITLTLILSTFLFINCYSQSFSDLTHTALDQLGNNKEKNLEQIYLRLLPAYIKEHIEEYQNAVSAASAGNKTEAFEQLNLLLSDTASIADLIDYGLFKEIKVDENFKPLHKDRRWQSIMAKMNNIEKRFDNSIRKELIEIHNSDQSIRLLVLEVYKKYGKESEEAKKVRAIMKRIDDSSSTKIQNIIDDKGWLGIDEIGETGNKTLFLAIQHVDDSIVQQKYLPILRNAVMEGKAEAWHYAFLQDRILMNQGKFQIYGTQKVTSDDPDKSYIIPLQDPDNVDSLRAEVGLGPLKESLEEEGMIWNLEDYKERLPEIKEMYKERYLKLETERDKQ